MLDEVAPEKEAVNEISQEVVQKEQKEVEQTALEESKKRELASDTGEEVPDAAKKVKTEEPLGDGANDDSEAANDGGRGEAKESDIDPEPIPPSKEGTTIFNDADVLSGRGGGTNVHPGNRQFRDLINMHRRAYLKARKNDKPAISRAIVKTIRDSNGRFLRKDEKTGLWFEIGDDAAREKTSQALRQRAPEMRKLLFDTEREEARAAAEESLRQQRMMMSMPPPEMMAGMPMQGMPPGMAPRMPPGMPMAPGGAPMFPNPAFFGLANNKNAASNGQEPYAQMFSAALLGGGVNHLPQNAVTASDQKTS